MRDITVSRPSRHRVVTAIIAVLIALAVGVMLNVAPNGTSTATASALVNPQSLGATQAADGSVTFNVFSSTATQLGVYLYSTPGTAQAAMSATMTKSSSGNVFSATVTKTALTNAGITGTIYYGYRAWGPNWPFNAGWTPGSNAGFITDVDANGNRFNPNKLLLDPYAGEVSNDPLTPSMNNQLNYASGASSSGTVYRTIDTGPFAPLGIVIASSVNQSTGTHPTESLKDDVVYEVNVKGLTEQNPNVAANLRGTYAGAATQAGYLKALGVTAIELLPTMEFQNQTNALNNQQAVSTQNNALYENVNYWGYETYGFFAPDRQNASNQSPGGPTAEFQNMVAAFHAQGIKVFMDCVYNHTGEGYLYSNTSDTVENIFTFRGLDNITYNLLQPGYQQDLDLTGVGGTFNTANPTASQLISDSINHWSQTMGIDGVRFDEGAVLGNTSSNTVNQSTSLNFSPASGAVTALNTILKNVTERPAAGGSGVDLIVEPWSETSYEVGNFPAGYSMWNGPYRDTVRSAQNDLGAGQPPIGTLADVFAGSQTTMTDQGSYSGQAWLPLSAVNFLDIHDGYTLNDLYSCSTQSNPASGIPTAPAPPYGPSAGGTTSQNQWNQSGISNGYSQQQNQRQAARTGMLLLMTSAGVPMFGGGDELLRTINCNDNAYNVDQPGNYLSWTNNSVGTLMDPFSEQQNFQTFSTGMINFRMAHPAFRPLNYYTNAQITWLDAAAQTPNWASSNTSNQLAFQLNGNQFAGESAAAIYVGYNGGANQTTFTLPAPPSGTTWTRVADTQAAFEGQPTQFTATSGQAILPTPSGTLNYGIQSRSAIILVAQ